VLEFTGNFSFNGFQTLIKIVFSPVASGTSELEFIDMELNSSPVEYLSSGTIAVYMGSSSIGDTLTVIQQPIQNIPAIAVPGEEIEITCIAPDNTTNWQADLLYGQLTTPLDISSASYSQELQRWTIKAIASQVELFELYDLRITASDGIEDVSKNTVQIIPEYKDNYYFAHITDTHLPTHYYYEDPESAWDTI